MWVVVSRRSNVESPDAKGKITSRGKIVQRQKNFSLQGKCLRGNIIRHKGIAAGKLGEKLKYK